MLCVLWKSRLAGKRIEEVCIRETSVLWYITQRNIYLFQCWRWSSVFFHSSKNCVLIFPRYISLITLTAQGMIEFFQWVLNYWSEKKLPIFKNDRGIRTVEAHSWKPSCKKRIPQMTEDIICHWIKTR